MIKLIVRTTASFMLPDNLELSKQIAAAPQDRPLNPHEVVTALEIVKTLLSGLSEFGHEAFQELLIEDMKSEKRIYTLMDKKDDELMKLEFNLSQ